MSILIPASAFVITGIASAIYLSWNGNTKKSKVSADIIETNTDFKDVVGIEITHTIPEDLKKDIISQNYILKIIIPKHVETKQNKMFILRDNILLEQKSKLKHVHQNDKSNCLVEELKKFRKHNLKNIGTIVRLATTSNRSPVHKELLAKNKPIY